MDWHRLQLLNFRRLSLMIIIFFVKRKWPEKVVHHGFSWLVRNMEVKLLETDEVEVIFVCLWNRNWTLNWDVFYGVERSDVEVKSNKSYLKIPAKLDCNWI